MASQTKAIVRAHEADGNDRVWSIPEYPTFLYGILSFMYEGERYYLSPTRYDFITVQEV